MAQSSKTSGACCVRDCLLFRLPTLNRGSGFRGVVLQFLGCIKCMRCRLLLPMFAVFVSLSACYAAQLGFTVRKRLNRSRSCLGKHSWGPKEHCVRWGSWSPHSEGREFNAAFANLLWPLVIKQTSRMTGVCLL